MNRGWHLDDEEAKATAALLLQYGVPAARAAGVLDGGRFADLIERWEEVAACLPMSDRGQSHRDDEEASSTDLVQTDEVAAVLGVTRRHASRLVAGGIVRGRRLGGSWVVARADLDRYLERREAS